MEPSSAAPSKASVFVSYSRKDLAFVNELCAALKADGREVWVDLTGIPPTAEWLDSIYRAIEAHDASMFVLSPDYIASSVCGLEIAHAATHNKRMVPLLLRKCEDKAVPETLRRLNWIVFEDTKPLGALLERLAPALDTDLPWVQLHARLLVRAQNWESKGRDGSRLLRGRDLKEAEGWLADAARHSSLQPSPLHLEYLAASRRADKRRQRIIFGSTALALVVSIVLAIWALRERNVARNQTQLSVANNLLVESQSERHAGDSGTQLRILLAVESLQRLLKQGRDSTAALDTVDAIASLRARKLGAKMLATAPQGVVLSARGDRVATWNATKVAIHDTPGMVLMRDIVAQREVTIASFDRLATLIAIGTDGYIEVHELGAADTPPTLLRCEGRPYVTRIDASGARGVTLTLGADRSTRLCLWSTRPAKMLAQLQVPSAAPSDGPAYGDVAFSADSAFAGALLPIGPGQNRAVLLDATSGQQRRAWDLSARQASIAFRGDRLIVADDTAVWGWSAKENREISRWNLDAKAHVHSFSADGRFAVVSLESGHSWVMDDFSYQRFGVFDTAGGIELAQMEYLPTLTADGRYLRRGDELREFPSMRLYRVVPQQSDSAWSALSDDNSTAITVGKANDLIAWTLAGSPEALHMPLHPAAPVARAWSSHGPWFAYAGARDVRLINLHDPANVTIALAEHRVEGLRLSGQDRYLIAVGETSLTAWELPDLHKSVRFDLGAPAPAPRPCGLLDSACRRATEETWVWAVDPLFVSESDRYIAWTPNGTLRIWTLPDGVLRYSSSQPGVVSALLENGARLFIGQGDGRVKVLDAASWQPLGDITLPLKRIDALVALPGANLIAAVTNDAQWSYALFEPLTGTVKNSNTGTGVLGPWSAAGRVAIAAGETAEILNAVDGTRISATVSLKKSVAQAVRPLAFTANSRFLVIRSFTPITLGETEQTLHIIDAGDGREVLRYPVRDINADSIKLDRNVPYPEGIFVDGTPDRVGATVYRNADAMWSVAASSADSRLTIWDLSTGALTTRLSAPLSLPSRLAGFADDGRFVVTVPEFKPTDSEVAGYALRVWSVGRDERLRLACLAAEGQISAQQWQQYIGAFTGESPQPTCP